MHNSDTVTAGVSQAPTSAPPGAHEHHADMDPGARTALLRRGLRLEYFSLTWNLIETVVGMIAGVAAGSVALVAFALDSVVESTSAAIMVWRLRNEGSSRWDVESIERRAVRAIAVAFWALAVYVGVQAVLDLVSGERPDDSPLGIGLATLSLVVMPLLARSKRSMASRLDSRALQADARQTSLCTYLSAVLLVGLLATSLIGWWWADPVAGLVIAAFAAKEGYELWTTEHFCAC